MSVIHMFILDFWLVCEPQYSALGAPCWNAVLTATVLISLGIGLTYC